MSQVEDIKTVEEDFESEEFGIMIDFIDGIVGSHSIWKRALIHTRRSGCNRDNLNVRGGWERFKQMVDTYLDSDISY